MAQAADAKEVAVENGAEETCDCLNGIHVLKALATRRVKIGR